MAETAYLVIPDDAADTAPRGPDDASRDTGGASSGARGHAGLEARIREHLPRGDVEYLAGVDAWTIRLPDGESATWLREMLAGLPLTVADDATFYTS